MFSDYVGEALTKLANYTEHEALKCVEIQLISNLCSFLEYFIERYKAVLQRDDSDTWLRPLTAFFAFSFYWAFGGHYGKERRFLDNTMRGFFGSILGENARADTPYEYCIEP